MPPNEALIQNLPTMLSPTERIDNPEAINKNQQTVYVLIQLVILIALATTTVVWHLNNKYCIENNIYCIENNICGIIGHNV